jgi:exodeoxyribonuclease V beta subunit
VAGVVTEPETAGVQDEPDGTGEPDVGTPDGTELRMADLPAGAAFGTLVHSVLERVDTGVADLPAEVLARCQEAGAGRFAGVDADRLAAALTAVLDTPLGPAAGGLALRDVRPADRLSELDFELPLAGGDTPLGPGATVGGFADLLRRHLPTDDPFRAYADRLSTAEFAGARLRGYLTGSLDAVLRLPDTSAGGSAGGSARGPSAEPRYLVVDYKTNRLAAPFEPLTPWHYRPAALVEAMIEADYPLQLLLYLVALHRFLCWRQPGYDPDRQLAGGLYLFVRGMSGPRTETFDGAPAGVLAWRPPAELVVALSELIAGGTP